MNDTNDSVVHAIRENSEATRFIASTVIAFFAWGAVSPAAAAMKEEIQHPTKAKATKVSSQLQAQQSTNLSEKSEHLDPWRAIDPSTNETRANVLNVDYAKALHEELFELQNNIKNDRDVVIKKSHKSKNGDEVTDISIVGLPNYKNVRSIQSKLLSLKRELATAQQRDESNFARDVENMKVAGLPTEILRRSYDARALYEQRYQESIKAIDEIASSSSSSVINERASALINHLNQWQPAPQSFDPNHLPFKVAEKKIRAPKDTVRELKDISNENYRSSESDQIDLDARLQAFNPEVLQPSFIHRKEIEVASAGAASHIIAAMGSLVPGPDYLTESDDVQFTQSISDLAVQLHHDPVEIFGWVRNNIEFIPTYGSTQGSKLTLIAKRGNSFDIASLLIALMRVSGIPAGFVYGTIQVPIDQAANWVGGVDSAQQVQNLLAYGGIPNVGIASGGKIVAVKLEHVWVEAYINFTPSRGAKNGESHQWVPMDASFKQYSFEPRTDLSQTLPIDNSHVNDMLDGATVNASEGWVQNIKSSMNTRAIEDYGNSIFDLLGSSTQPSEALLGKKIIQERASPVLAAGLPYRVIVATDLTSKLSPAFQYQLKMTLYNSQSDQAAALPALTYSSPLTKINSAKIGITYRPASSADSAAMQNASGSFPAYAINVIPAVQLDGLDVAGGNSIQMGSSQIWEVSIISPVSGRTTTDVFTKSAGDESVLGLDLSGTTQSMLDNRFSRFTSNTASENLFSISLAYWWLHDLQDQLISGKIGVHALRLPSVGMFSSPLKVVSSFGVTTKAAYVSREMDIKRVVVGVSGATHEKEVEFATESGVAGSLIEGRIFDALFHHESGESISAVQMISAANDAGVRIYSISQENSSVLSSLSIPSSVKSEISAAISNGFTAIVPAQQIVRGAWSGLGYIIQDPNSGSGAYLISGGLNGGYENICNPQEETAPKTSNVAPIVAGVAFIIIIAAIIVMAPELTPAAVQGIKVAMGVLSFAAAATPAIASAADLPPNIQALWDRLFASQHGPFRASGPFPGDGIPIPGNCPADTYDQLKKAQDEACAKPTKCLGTQDCDALRDRLDNRLACMETRMSMMEICFSGGNEEHWNHLEQELNGLNRCICMMSGKGCPGNL